MNTKDRVYDFIVQYTSEHLYPPSFTEIGKGVGIYSKATIFTHIHKLEDESRIELGDSGQPRCIKLVGYKLVKIGGKEN